MARSPSLLLSVRVEIALPGKGKYDERNQHDKTKVQLSRDLLQSKLERELVAVVQSVVARMKS